MFPRIWTVYESSRRQRVLWWSQTHNGTFQKRAERSFRLIHLDRSPTHRATSQGHTVAQFHCASIWVRSFSFDQLFSFCLDVLSCQSSISEWRTENWFVICNMQHSCLHFGLVTRRLWQVVDSSDIDQYDKHGMRKLNSWCCTQRSQEGRFMF